ncbi:MAG: hypothetical protein PHC30_01820 [Lentisphaeria bacterium]|nr:hypothetical protein [Lentisphaeria bacterium]
MTRLVSIESGHLKIEFARSGGGFPTRVALRGRDGEIDVLMHVSVPALTAELADGRTVRPVVPADYTPRRVTRDGIEIVECSRLPWVDEAGALLDGFHLSLRHEFHPDGTAFTSAFFTVEAYHGPCFRHFRLRQTLQLDQDDEVRWHLCRRPGGEDGHFIQSVIPERFLARGESRRAAGIFPLTGFCARRPGGAGLYAEFFVEGDNTVSGDPAANESSVIWEDGNAVLTWDFQSAPMTPRVLPRQWRNTWGWVLSRPPACRRLPPLRMYHYIDLQRHYPSDVQVEEMAAAGCDVFVMHENWRLDVQNDGLPYDEIRFARLVEQLHRQGIRLAVYIRGNELSVVEDECAWFDTYLQRGFDGLYMDYGSPFGEVSGPDETWQNGRVKFRRHYLKLRRLREVIGEGGVFYSHTGPLYSALGSAFLDGYVSGEGERGILVKGRQEHEYFSMAYASLGTMWTAAFPEYSSPRMAPFLAAAGQYPHNPLGTQVPTSSLAHPQDPGLNDVPFQPLWHLWSCFRNERDLAVYNDFNGRGVFGGPDETIGHYLMVSGSGRRGLLVLGNFSSAPAACRPVVDLAAVHLRAGAQAVLQPGAGGPGQPRIGAAAGVMPEVVLPGYGVAGVLWAEDERSLAGLLQEYVRPYPGPGAESASWLAAIEQQRRFREGPPAWKEVYLTVRLPGGAPLPYEDSLIVDLYNNQLELLAADAGGDWRVVAPVGKSGVVASAEAAAADQLFVGDVTAPMALHELLGPGRHRLGLRSLHLGEPFYSFVSLVLSPSADPSADGHYQLEFYNAVEPDRSMLTWTTVVAAPSGAAD